MTAAQLTDANMDKSDMLPKLFGRRPEVAKQRALAELQVAFVSFLCGKSMEGVRHLLPVEVHAALRVQSECAASME
jgi:AAR2 protein